MLPSVQFASSPLAPLKLDSYRVFPSPILRQSPTSQDVFFPLVRAQQYEMYKGTWYMVTVYADGTFRRVPYQPIA